MPFFHQIWDKKTKQKRDGSVKKGMHKHIIHHFSFHLFEAGLETVCFSTSYHDLHFCNPFSSYLAALVYAILSAGLEIFYGNNHPKKNNKNFRAYRTFKPNVPEL
jgi:hypothetical protein